jgi:hypothetical protein
MQEVQDTILRLDRPPKDLLFTAYLLLAKDSGDNTDLPSKLESLIREMKTNWGYRSFSLIDTLLFRRIERMDRHVIKNVHYEFATSDVEVTGEGGGVTVQARLSVFMKTPYATKEEDRNLPFIDDEVELPVDRPFIVGRDIVNAEGDALILVASVSIPD